MKLGINIGDTVTKTIKNNNYLKPNSMVKVWVCYTGNPKFESVGK